MHALLATLNCDASSHAHREGTWLSCDAGAAPAVLQDDLQGELLGIASPLSIYYLGIGPYIDASWTISLIMLCKSPPGINRHLQSLRRAGREVWPLASGCGPESMPARLRINACRHPTAVWVRPCPHVWRRSYLWACGVCLLRVYMRWAQPCHRPNTGAAGVFMLPGRQIQQARWCFQLVAVMSHLWRLVYGRAAGLGGAQGRTYDLQIAAAGYSRLN